MEKEKEKNIIHKSNNKVNQSMLTGIPQADWCKVKWILLQTPIQNLKYPKTETWTEEKGKRYIVRVVAVEYKKEKKTRRKTNIAEKGMKSSLAFPVNLAVTEFLIGATVVDG